MDKILFQEIPKSAQFHSVLMTSYAFDFYHFESQVLKSLKRKGVLNFNAILDAGILDDTIGFSTGNLKALSKSYSITGLKSKGVFHPKLIVLAGYNSLLIVQGSGNITNGGHGKNHELFSVLYADKNDESQLPLLQEAWQYVKGLVSDLEGFSIDKIEWIEKNCSLLKMKPLAKHNFYTISADFSVKLLYNDGDSGIYKQLISSIPNDEISEIFIFSPFYDEKGSLVGNVADTFGNAYLKVFLQEKKGTHPFRMEEDKRIQFFNWNSTKRSRSKSRAFDRKLHSKLFVFNSVDYQYFLIGSPNATLAAFGNIHNRGVNDEFAVLVKTSGFDIIEYLKLDGSYKKIKPTKQSKAQLYLEERDTAIDRKNIKLKLNTVDLDFDTLICYFQVELASFKATLCFFDKWGELLFQQAGEIVGRKFKCILKDKEVLNRVSYVQFTKSDVPVSYKVIVNRKEDLWGTNPSEENRNIHRLTSLIEFGTNRKFDIIKYFNDLENSKATEEKDDSNSKVRTSIDKEEIESQAVSMTYEEAMAFEGTINDRERLMSNHSSVQIADAIIRRMNLQDREKEEAEMDDEEEGDVAKSNPRRNTAKKEPFVVRSISVLNKHRRRLFTFLDNYFYSVDVNFIPENYEVTFVDLASYMLRLMHLIEYAGKEIKFKRDDEVVKPDDGVLLPFKGSLVHIDSYSGALLNLVADFTSLLINSEMYESGDSFIRKKQDDYIDRTLKTTLFALANAKSFYADHSNGLKWLELVVFNLFKQLGTPKGDFLKFFTRELAESNFVEHSVIDLQKTVEEWVSKYTQNDWGEIYLSDKGVGICEITKSIPEGMPKFYRIARPGFEYNEKQQNFELDDLYEIATGRLIKSKQKLVRGRYD